jgi:hypothetical protein
VSLPYIQFKTIDGMCEFPMTQPEPIWEFIMLNSKCSILSISVYYETENILQEMNCLRTVEYLFAFAEDRFLVDPDIVNLENWEAFETYSEFEPCCFLDREWRIALNLHRQQQLTHMEFKLGVIKEGEDLGSYCG